MSGKIVTALLLVCILSVQVTASAGDAEWFTDIAEASGLDFVHFNGMSGEFYLVENLGGGAALLDYDRDGDLDIFITQGRMLGKGKTLTDALFPPRQGEILIDRLYRNDTVVTVDGTHTIRFTDVTGASGIHSAGYGMGVAVGDVDNDGWLDLYVTNLGPNQLWHNNGDGTFSDITGKAGVGEERLTVSAAFVDYDRDGWLDLFLANYVAFSTDNNRPCYAPSSARDYCSPKVYKPLSDRLFRNRGDGSFEDVSRRSGISTETGTALGVVVADFNSDGWPDIYVANDGLANHLWMNRQDGTFQDEGLLSGTAVNMEGMAEASMGVDAADFDGDGDEDLFMTHLIGETNTIYVNNGDGWFEDRTVATGLSAGSKSYTSFGTAWFDYDNDGDLDLLIANGGVNIILSLVQAKDPYPLHQPNQLFANLGNGRFKEVTSRAGGVFNLSEVSRGAAFGDIDNDGDTDVMVVNNGGRARLLINNLGNRNHWLGLRLLDKRGRDAFGARVAVYRDNGVVQWRRARAEGSYASANDPRVLVGLGDSAQVSRVRVHW
ncbi:MAG: CRTAC1 family protein, partial [Gammaproteobacteria bacterium]|nr:CRTAC1 family protein [Gammaproteobacteria bacterium]